MTMPTGDEQQQDAEPDGRDRLEARVTERMLVVRLLAAELDATSTIASLARSDSE